jgi:hypothetical protein
MPISQVRSVEALAAGQRRGERVLDRVLGEVLVANAPAGKAQHRAAVGGELQRRRRGSPGRGRDAGGVGKQGR